MKIKVDPPREVLDKNLWLEFMTEGTCGLCGGSGVIESHIVGSVASRVVFVPKHPCICPIGRDVKQHDLLKEKE